MGGSTMFKWLLATVAGAAITAGAVYVAQHPEVLEAKPTKSSTHDDDNSEQAALSEALSGKAPEQEQSENEEPSGSKAVIDRLVKKPKGERDKRAEGKKRKAMMEAEAEIEAEIETENVTITEQADFETAVETVVVDTLPMEIDDGPEQESDEQESDDSQNIDPVSDDPESNDIDITSAGEETLIDIEQEMIASDEEAAQAGPVVVESDDMDSRVATAEKFMLVDQILAQAEQIENPDLRDQAYLDLVDYSLRESNFDMAKHAMTKMQQIELRDNARGRIAESYARAGDSVSAFAMIDDVEIEEFRDFTRLRVIQAFIVQPKPQQRP